MADDQQLTVLRQGSGAWNAWRKENPNVQANLGAVDLIGANLSGANLSGAVLVGARLQGADLSRANLEGADLFEAILSWDNLSVNLYQANLSGAQLVGAEIRWAHLPLANLSGADLWQAHLDGAHVIGANLSGANLSQAHLVGTNLIEANLSGADLSRARLEGANLSRANLTEADLNGADLTAATLVRTNFTAADLTGCRVYGISAWDLVVDEETKQQDLIITPEHQPNLIVDDLEVAQVIYVLSDYKKIRDVIETISTKAVLILGRFTRERKAVLDALREELRKRDRIPIVFDFDPLKSKNVTDTVKLLALLARYIIVDLSDPNSAPYELGVISMLGLDSTPVVPVITSGQRPFPMLDDVLRKPWSTKLVRYQDLDDIRANLDEMLIKIAEAKVQELRGTSPPTA